MLVLFEMLRTYGRLITFIDAYPMGAILRRRNCCVETLRSMGAAANPFPPAPGIKVLRSDVTQLQHVSSVWSLSASRTEAGTMANDVIDLDQLQANYKAAVEDWIAAIKQEEALASVNHTVAEVDKWEAAHFAEDDLRKRVKAAKKEYENALREKFFGF
jgi:hypothetical protein